MFFWLNHPIRYVRLVGMVVQIDVVAQGKFALLTLDDGSGANIEVKVERRQTGFGEDAVYLSETTVDNLRVAVHLGTPMVRLDGKPLAIGAIIRAQGIITSFMRERQLLLKRVFSVKDTNEEAAWWAKVASWKASELSAPWVLTETERRAFDEKLHRAELMDRMKADRLRRREEKARRRERRAEKERQVEEIVLSSGALIGSETILRPWE